MSTITFTVLTSTWLCIPHFHSLIKYMDMSTITFTVLSSTWICLPSLSQSYQVHRYVYHHFHSLNKYLHRYVYHHFHSLIKYMDMSTITSQSKQVHGNVSHHFHSIKKYHTHFHMLIPWATLSSPYFKYFWTARKIQRIRKRPCIRWGNVVLEKHEIYMQTLSGLFLYLADLSRHLFRNCQIIGDIYEQNAFT